MRERAFQWLLIVSFLAFCWLGFTVVHESGHVVVAWLTGGTVSRVVLHPLQISWSAFAPNPHPRLVGWGGPLLGALTPLALHRIARAARWPGECLIQFFAGFCLIANGLYILIDAFDRNGDAGTLLREGAASWQIILFGLIAAPIGFWCWHGLGPHFGLGPARGKVSHSAVIVSLGLLATVVITELLLY